ncbi:MAG: hypothetical protein KAJ19_06810, partial [Gammaproteobacteria bacterium]|nr:hypothetical protein [Gammaproteobacteria bacterium]
INILIYTGIILGLMVVCLVLAGTLSYIQNPRRKNNDMELWDKVQRLMLILIDIIKEMKDSTEMSWEQQKTILTILEMIKKMDGVPGEKSKVPLIAVQCDLDRCPYNDGFYCTGELLIITDSGAEDGGVPLLSCAVPDKEDDHGGEEVPLRIIE